MMNSSSNDLTTITIGKWEWRSDSDPWPKGEPPNQPKQPQWKPYSLDHNDLIEKAYYDQLKEVDLGDYLVYPLDLFQIKKGNLQKQRPIRRVNWMSDEEMNDRSARYFETELPKTLNKIFGSLEDFLSFFSRRNPEISLFQKEFETFEQSKDLNVLKNKIIPQLISCLEKELLNPIVKQLQDPSLSIKKTNDLLSTKEKNVKLISLFQKDFSSVEEFYGQILKSYTMETILYANLNKYLRNESWVEVDNLLPYLFCLCKAFFNVKSNPSLKDSFIVYKGVALDEAALMSYSMKEIERFFSWYAVISTSRSAEIAKEFMTRLAKRNKKKPVMFIIEIPVAGEDLKWIDVQKYSAIPKEDEVILAPGSIFELIDISTDQNTSITTIKLKLKGGVQSLAHGGMMMQGTLQSQMMTEKEAKIMCLEREELSQALESLCGNKLVEEVEFCLCTFNRISFNKMFEILPTLEKTKELKFRACISQDNRKIAIQRPKKGEKCEVTKIEVIEANDFFKMICNETQGQEYWVSLRELDLSFANRKSLKDKELNFTISQGLKSLPQLTHLKINFEWCEQITDEGVNNLAQGLNSLIHLTNLSLNFEWCQQITDKGVHSLTEGLNSLTKLMHLNLNFKYCEHITDTGMESLSQRLNSFTRLTHLNLNFRLLTKIKDAGMACFSQGLSSLTQLTHLDLDLGWCVQVTDKGMESLAQCLNSLTQLTHINLHLGGWRELTCEGVKCLMLQGLKNLAQLTSLILDFERCFQVSRSDLQNLLMHAYKWLHHLHSITPLILIKDRIQNIEIQTQDQLNDISRVKLVRESLFQDQKVFYEKVSLLQKVPMDLLPSEEKEKLLAQNFMTIMVSMWRKDNELFDREAEALKKGQSYLKTHKIIPLTSDFEGNSRDFIDLFSEASLAFEIGKILLLSHQLPLLSGGKQGSNMTTKLIDQAIQNQKTDQTLFQIYQATSLTFEFKGRSAMITNECVHTFSSQVLKDLSQLRSLTLIFDDCYEMKDEGVRNLALHGFKYLTGLTSLKLKFITCKSVTDKGLTDLAQEGLRYLSQLKSFDLFVFRSGGIADEGFINLARYGLRHLSQLETLSLQFNEEFHVSDLGVDGLISFGLKNLTQLKFLVLCLAGSAVTDKGVNNLVLKVVKNLPSLAFLDLNLYGCSNVSPFTVQNLRNILHYFGFTKIPDSIKKAYQID